MNGYISNNKSRINKLEEKKREYELKIQLLKDCQTKLISIETEFKKLSKEIVSKDLSEERKIELREQINQLQELEKETHWSSLDLGERFEHRKLSLITFNKYSESNQYKIHYERLLMEYCEITKEILNGEKQIWWEGILTKAKYKFLKLLNNEYKSILKERLEIHLQPEEEFEKMFNYLERDGFRTKYKLEEWDNLKKFKELYEEIQKSKRIKVYFL